MGLSIGTTNLVAARVGAPPVSRRSILTLYGQRPPEVGLPSENPRLTEAGAVMRGFVERVGDPVPLTAPDGSSHPADRLLADALGAMVDTVGPAGSVVVAVPSHWEPAAARALSAALARDPRFSPSGTPPRLVSQVLAALVAVQAEPGLTAGGVIVLLDLGVGGTTISLVDTQGFQPIGESVRYESFSGDQIDKLMLSAVLAAAGDTDPRATAAVGSLARVRDECRQAKERLSTLATTTIPVDMGRVRAEIPFSRGELEDLIDGPINELLASAEGLLARHHRHLTDVSAVAVVGGGANIPLVRQRLSERLHRPVVVPARPAQAGAIGAALMAARGPAADATTIGIGAEEPALAWSQDDRPPSEPMPQPAVNPYAGSTSGDARPAVEFVLPTGPISTPEPKPNRLARYAVGAAAVIAVIAVAGMVHSVISTSSTTTTTPSTTTPSTTSTTTAPPLPLPPPPEPVAPPPEPTYVAPPPEPETVTQTIPPATTTTVPTTTTTVPTTTTTVPTTITTPTATPTTPPTTTQPTTTQPAMTTTYITVPFVPVPIPIPVPNPQQ